MTRRPLRPGPATGRFHHAGPDAFTTAILALVLLGAGAGGQATLHGQVAGVEFRDSAGITLVLNPETPVGGPGGWRVTERPALRIGVLDGRPEETFSGVFHGTVLADGRIIVANTNPIEARVFDSMGRHLVSFGREGRGPAEFIGRISQVTLAEPDTVGLRNGRLGVHLFLADGSFLRTVPGSIQSGVYDWLGHGRFLLRTAIRTAEPPEVGVIHLADRYSIWSAETQREDTLGVFSGIDQYRNGEAGTIPTVIPYGRRTFTAFGAGRVYVAYNAAYSIQVFSVDGSLERVIRKRYRPLAVSAEDRDAGVRRALQGPLFRAPLPDQILAGLERQVREAPIPDTHPAFEELVVDRVGFLWVRSPSPTGAAQVRWDVFSPEGILTATVAVPAVWRVLEIGEDYLLAVSRDDYEVEYVEMYGIRR